MEQQCHEKGRSDWTEALLLREEWSETELVNDSRYLNVVARIDDLIRTSTVHPERDLRGDLEQLVSATMKQIVSEESFMVLAEFPQVKQHRMEHLNLWDAAMKLRFRLGTSEVRDDLHRLHGCWMEHMRVHDRIFERYLNIRRG